MLCLGDRVAGPRPGHLPAGPLEAEEDTFYRIGLRLDRTNAMQPRLLALLNGQRLRLDAGQRFAPR